MKTQVTPNRDTPFKSLEKFFKGSPKKAVDYQYSFKFFENIVGKNIEIYMQEKPSEVQFIADMEKFANWLKVQPVTRHSKPMTGTKLTQNTIKTRLAAVRSYASENGIIMSKTDYKNLFDVNTKGKFIDDALKDKAYTLDEAREVFKRLTPTMQPLFLTLLSNGMRINEALQVKISDVNFKKNPVQIFIPAENTKTNTERTTFISTEAANLLKDQWIPGLPKYLAGKKRNDWQKTQITEGLLFPMTEANFRQALMKATGGAGLNTNGRNEYHVHSLRKSTRTLLGNERYHDLGEYLLGHKTGMDKHYVKLSVEQAAKQYKEAEKYLTIGDTLKRQIAAESVEIAELRAQLKKYIDKEKEKEDRMKEIEKLVKNMTKREIIEIPPDKNPYF